MRYVILLWAAIIFIVYSLTTNAQVHGTTWTWERCYTNVCVQSRLNSLSPNAAAAAKLTTWENVTFVWYPK